MKTQNPYFSARARALLNDALTHQPPRLDWAALAVASLEYPQLDVPGCEEKLDALAQRVRRTRDDGPPAAGLDALRQVLVEEEGFRGNRERYGDAENSFLNRVLERRVGLPITLSVVYLEVARRAGVPLYGVAFPGHFLTAAAGGPAGRRRPVVLDPFNGGQVLSEDDCARLLKRVAPNIPFSPRMLAPASVEAVAYRMLNNLKQIYLGERDGARAVKVVDLMLMIVPDHPGELRVRAGLLSALGAYRAALEDLHRCLTTAPDAPDADALRAQAREIRQRLQFMN